MISLRYFGYPFNIILLFLIYLFLNLFSSICTIHIIPWTVQPNKICGCNISYFSISLSSSFHKSTSVASEIFNLVHSDVWGLASVQSKGGTRYFVIFINNCSRYTWIYLLKNRSELLQVYRELNTMVRNQNFKTN